MSEPIKMVVFDMAGTTVNDEGNITEAFADAMEAYGYEVPAAQINPLMGYKKPVAIKMMLEIFEPNKQLITGGLIDLIHERFVENMMVFYKQTQNLYALPNVETVFAELRRRGIKVCLNTGFSREIADVILGRLGWWQAPLVDDLIASDEVAEGRPAPFMIETLMQRAGLTSASAVVKVGDTEVDVHEGKNAGCRATVAVTTGAFSRAAIEPYAPNFIIDNMADLLPIVDQLNQA
jgi:phosphonatase-like hydrolase